MKLTTGTIFASASGLLVFCNQQAHSAYTGLTVQLIGDGVVVDGAARDIYRVYACFSEPDDYLVGVNGNPAVPMVIQNVLSDGMALGTGFFNPGGVNSNTAPYDQNEGDEEFGTFVTIGLPLGSMGPGGIDATEPGPGFPNFIAGNQLITNTNGWFTGGPHPQGQASYIDEGFGGNYVMIMQLAVNDGQHVRGTLNLNSNQILGQTFTSIPGPSALALGAVFALAGARRRRSYNSQVREPATRVAAIKEERFS